MDELICMAMFLLMAILAASILIPILLFLVGRHDG